MYETGTKDDYTYDANGNMISDLNKGISEIKYNHLNLPTEISWTGSSNKIRYVYNAAGQKVKKTVVDGTTTKIVDYLDGFQYAGEVLQFFPHPEGYVKASPTNLSLNSPPTGYIYNYVYNYTDHLGNVRLSYSKNPATNQLNILEENHYYPFGLKHEVYISGGKRDYRAVPDDNEPKLIGVTKTDYQYKYNGKEWQDELGLNIYDMDMRQYDPAIARWVVMDPIIHHSLSPYNAFDNNPVFWADPSGANAESGNQTVTATTGVTLAFGVSLDSVIEGGAAIGFSGNISFERGDTRNSGNSAADARAAASINDNGDDPPAKNNENKGPATAKNALEIAGEYGKESLKNGEYTQTDGKKGNFNDRSFNKLSQNAKTEYNRALGLSKLRVLGPAGNIYGFGNGVWQDWQNYNNTNMISIDNTAVATGGIVGGIFGGALAGFYLGAHGANPFTIAAGTVFGGIIGGIVGEEAVKDFQNQARTEQPILHKR